MRIRLEIEVDVNPAGLARYYAEYPAFLRDNGPDARPETPADTLIREATTAWDYEALLGSGEAVKVIKAEVIAMAEGSI